MRSLRALDSVDPREAWDNEAHDFTSWLADNLGHLATAIGFELEREGTEMHVDPLRADIVARTPRDDSQVLIENQLENAHLNHLCRVFAYLAGLEAKTVVWAANGLDESHLSALQLAERVHGRVLRVLRRPGSCGADRGLIPGAGVRGARTSERLGSPCTEHGHIRRVDQARPVPARFLGPCLEAASG